MVGNTIEIDWNAGAPPYINTRVVPTQIEKKKHSSAINSIDCTEKANIEPGASMIISQGERNVITRRGGGEKTSPYITQAHRRRVGKYLI